PLTAAAAGDLARVSVPLGDDGLSARLSFGGIVLEPRAVGATVTAPALSLSTDGDTGLVHLTLPTWNCLEAVAPVDPAAAGCTPALTEYADLATPELRVTARDGEFEISGDFATYTRPNGSAPTYTGRSYSLTVQAGPDGRFRDGAAPATGEFSLGGSSTSTLADDGLSVVQTG
ncbi:MAG: rane protein of unknown function, partial [Klenkia sp.]|nr:rane protein of unknown function [Klenkia sp.]